MSIEFTDRYKALGIPYPDPATMCQGQCEGTGYVPVFSDIAPRRRDSVYPNHDVMRDPDERLRRAWTVAHERCPWLLEPCDGWHFVVCPDCNGTRLRHFTDPQP